MLRHVKSAHGGDPSDVEDRLHYVVKGKTVFVASSEVDQYEEPISTAVFECRLCPYTSDYNHHMQIHMRQHSPREDAPIKCPHCPYWVKYKKSLNSHLRFHSSERSPSKPTSPPYAPVQQEEEEDEEEENEEENDVDAESLEENPFREPTSTYLHSPERKFKCDVCSFKTDHKPHFLYHKQFHRPNKNAPFKCSFCSFWSSFKKIMDHHMVSHSDLETSGTKLSSPKGRNAKMLSEIAMIKGKPVRMYKCRFCPLKNRRPSNIRLHESRHLDTDELKYSCDQCSFKSNHHGVMKSHVRLHNENISIADIWSESLKHPPESVSVNEEELPVPDVVERDPKAKKVITYTCSGCPAVFRSKSDYNTHNSFHGSELPFPCPHCDYTARHRLHLKRHMTVHTPQYLQKRNESLSGTIAKDGSGKVVADTQPEVEPMEFDIDDPDCLVVEKRNTMTYSKNQGTGRNSKRKQRCKACPMAFHHEKQLNFHKTLHKSGATNPCPKCTYAVNNIDVLNCHKKVHTKSIPAVPDDTEATTEAAPADVATVAPSPKAVFKILTCPGCPAVFTNNDKLGKHASLHTASNRHTCSECTYSVRFISTLNRHMRVHRPGYKPFVLRERKESVPAAVAEPLAIHPASGEPRQSPTKKGAAKAGQAAKEKHIYQCSQCPYTAHRKDSVVHHLNRHGVNTSTMSCPYCDYSCCQSSFLRDHIKSHFQPRSFIKVKAYMKYEQLEIWACNGNKTLLFKDQGEDQKDRFFPEMIEEEPEDLPEETQIKEEVVQEVKETEEHKETAVASSDNSSTQDESTLIEEALKVGRTLEVVLTDVLADKNNPAVRNLCKQGLVVSLTDIGKTKRSSTRNDGAATPNRISSDSCNSEDQTSTVKEEARNHMHTEEPLDPALDIRGCAADDDSATEDESEVVPYEILNGILQELDQFGSRKVKKVLEDDDNISIESSDLEPSSEPLVSVDSEIPDDLMEVDPSNVPIEDASPNVPIDFASTEIPDASMEDVGPSVPIDSIENARSDVPNDPMEDASPNIPIDSIEDVRSDVPNDSMEDTSLEAARPDVPNDCMENASPNVPTDYIKVGNADVPNDSMDAARSNIIRDSTIPTDSKEVSSPNVPTVSTDAARSVINDCKVSTDSKEVSSSNVPSDSIEATRSDVPNDSKEYASPNVQKDSIKVASPDVLHDSTEAARSDVAGPDIVNNSTVRTDSKEVASSNVPTHSIEAAMSDVPNENKEVTGPDIANDSTEVASSDVLNDSMEIAIPDVPNDIMENADPDIPNDSIVVAVPSNSIEVASSDVPNDSTEVASCDVPNDPMEVVNHETTSDIIDLMDIENKHETKAPIFQEADSVGNPTVPNIDTPIALEREPVVALADSVLIPQTESGSPVSDPDEVSGVNTHAPNRNDYPDEIDPVTTNETNLSDDPGEVAGVARNAANQSDSSPVSDPDGVAGVTTNATSQSDPDEIAGVTTANQSYSPISDSDEVADDTANTTNQRDIINETNPLNIPPCDVMGETDENEDISQITSCDLTKVVEAIDNVDKPDFILCNFVGQVRDVYNGDTRDIPLDVKANSPPLGSETNVLSAPHCEELNSEPCRDDLTKSKPEESVVQGIEQNTEQT